MLGCVKTCAQHGECSVPATFYIVKSGNPLMGMDLISSLNLCIQGNKVITFKQSVEQVSHSATPDFGCANHFVHRVNLRENAASVQQKLRRLPFSVRDAVSAEVNRLLAADIIERVDSSPWVSPIVVTQKKFGDICMCVDLREPNKAIVVDSYPIPHTEELFSQLRGAVMFSTIDLANAYHKVPLHKESRDLTAFIT